MLKIYGRANSINVRKVLWIADEVGEIYQRDDWGRGFRPLDEAEFQAINPMAAIPVIDDDGFILRESNVIVRYLADKHQRGELYPDDKKARFTVDAWMDWASTDLYWGVRPVFNTRVVRTGLLADPRAMEIGRIEWTARMGLLDCHLGERGPYMMGPMFTIADIPVGMVVNRWFSIDFEKPVLASVSAYYDRLSERPAYLLHGRNGTP